MPALSTAGDAGVLWLATLQRALARASHDVKDALNGVSVNLEVIRSRARRAGADGASLTPFADAAGQQLERLTNLLEAVLALGRAEREPVDVAVVLRRIATLCNASSSSPEAAIEVVHALGDPAVTPVRGEAVRLALAGPLLELVTSNGSGSGSRSTARQPIRCTVSTGGPAGDVIVVAMQTAGRTPAMPDAFVEVVRAAGVRWLNGTPEAAGDGRGSDGDRDERVDFSLVFPRA
jgi:hypothetical protein